MKRVAFAAAVALTLAVVAVAPAGAHQVTPATTAATPAPGAWCGGSLWKLMTLSDTNAKTVKWGSVQTSIPSIAALKPPTRVLATQRSAFEKQMWTMNVVIERYRVQSNGEIALELFDIPSSSYMNAYMPNPDCLSSKTRGRSQIVAARNAFTAACPAATTDWQPLGASVTLTGVGFWNPVKTTLGALGNGAEIRPVVGFTLINGCGKF
jgi:hypothetical protein